MMNIELPERLRNQLILFCESAAKWHGNAEKPAKEVSVGYGLTLEDVQELQLALETKGDSYEVVN